MNLRNLPAKIKIQLYDDTLIGEKEEFVLEMTSVQLITHSGEILEVLVSNSVTVAIIDNDGTWWNLVLFNLLMFFSGFQYICSDSSSLPG